VQEGLVRIIAAAGKGGADKRTAAKAPAETTS